MTQLQPRIFIQHAAKETRSAEKLIGALELSIEQLGEYFTKDEYNYLKGQKCPVVMRATDSGADGLNERTWAEMEVGDIALIAWRGHIEAAGEVVMRKDSPAIARSRRRDKHHFLYFLRNVERLHVPYAQLNRVLGYKSNNLFQRFRSLSQEQSTAVLNLLNDVAPELRTLSENTIINYTLKGELDRRSEVNRRCEQGVLRKLYFGNRNEGWCTLCGRDFPIEFLVAAHIKKRADCSDDEKRDVFGNIIPACRLGCDELFERGYIFGVEGVFKRSQFKPLTQALSGYIESIEGRAVQDWARRTKYFVWHAKNHS